MSKQISRKKIEEIVQLFRDEAAQHCRDDRKFRSLWWAALDEGKPSGELHVLREKQNEAHTRYLSARSHAWRLAFKAEVADRPKAKHQ